MEQSVLHVAIETSRIAKHTARMEDEGGQTAYPRTQGGRGARSLSLHCLSPPHTHRVVVQDQGFHAHRRFVQHLEDILAYDEREVERHGARTAISREQRRRDADADEQTRGKPAASARAPAARD